MDFNFELWQKKRRKTMFVYLCWGFAFGVDYSLILVSILPYLEQLVKTKRPQFYYGLCIFIYYSVSSITGVIIGRVIDRTRRVKLAMLVCLGFAITGNLLYSVYIYPIVLFIGRALVGFNDVLYSLLVGEILRIYDIREATRAQWWYIAACSAGYTTGSWISLTFTGINLKIEPVTLHASLQNSTLCAVNSTFVCTDSITIINEHNFVGLFLAFIQFLVLLLVICCAHDCSKEYDVKAVLYEQELKEINEIRNEKGDGVTIISRQPVVSSQDEPSNLLVQDINTTPATHEHNARHITQSEVCIILKGFLHHPEIVLLLTTSFLFAYVAFTLDLLIPLIVIDLFKWQEEILNIGYAAHSATYFFSMLLLSKFGTTNKRVYVVTICAIIFSIVCLSSTIVMHSTDLTETGKMIVFIIFKVSYTPVWFLDEVTMSNLLARIVHSDIQNFTEGLRVGFSKASYIIASLVIAAEIKLLNWACVMVGLTIISLMLYGIRMRRLTNLKITDI